MGLSVSVISLITASGAAVATGVGVTSTVWPRKSQNNNLSLSSEMDSFESRLSSLEKQFSSLPSALGEAMKTVMDSESLIQTLEEKVERIMEEQEQSNENISSAKAKVDGFASSYSKYEDTFKGLEYFLQSSEAKLTLLEKQMVKNLDASTEAIKMAQGAKELATNGVRSLQELVQNLASKLSEDFKKKINQEFTQKREELGAISNEKVESLKRETDNKIKQFKSSVEARIKKFEIEMKNINDRAWKAFLRLGLGAGNYSFK